MVSVSSSRNKEFKIEREKRKKYRNKENSSVLEMRGR